MPQDAAAPTWDPSHYDAHGRFISRYGLELLDWLAAQPGEQILDFGCGDGFLTQEIANTGADVLGVDLDPRMVEGTRARGLKAEHVDGTALRFEERFDAVFSNSVLQWIKQPDPALQSIHRALKPGGRFVVDVAGLGNLAAILVAMRAVGDELGGDPDLAFPFYAPTEDEFTRLLTANGFEIERSDTSPRYTALPSDLWNWIGSIFQPFFSQFDEVTNQKVRARVLELLEPVLRDVSGQWHIDHVRVRVIARKLG
ncbi:MAG: methyltransferase domain-containing protein [Pseudomonadota bacterium]